MIIGDVVALVCTADIGVQRLNEFLDLTYRYSEKQSGFPVLILVKSWNRLKNTSAPKATQPPIDGDIPVISDSLETLAKDIQEAAKLLPRHALDPNIFVVLDERSMTEDNGLIVQAKDNSLDSARVHFNAINTEVIRVGVMTGNIKDTKNLAAK